MTLRSSLLGLIDRFSGRRLVIAGDIIADEFLYGQIARVSREAPVLVLEYRDRITVPGGAANGANNLLDLGCKVAVVGVVGDDRAGAEVTGLLAQKGADVRLVRRERSSTTPVKTRILASAPHSAPQQVVRLDRVSELRSGVIPSTQRLRRITRSCHGIIMSDYGYGSASPETTRLLRPAAGEKRVPLVVDSRFRMGEYTGVTALTPNITEVESSVGTAIGNDATLLERISGEILRKQRLACLLVTQGRFGMTLFQKRARPLHIPIYGTDEVADVTGAGDTVTAVFTLSLSAGGTPEQAARLANYAGGIVVMKRGTATVTLSELRGAVERDLPD